MRAELEYRQAQVRLHQLENQVRIEVRNAQFDVKQNRAAVQAAQYAVDFARQTLDADQQKLKVGLTTTTAILQDASILTTSESNLVSAKAAYEKSRIELDRATGLLLDHTGINVAEATRGQVTHLPKVPYVVPRQDANPAGSLHSRRRAREANPRTRKPRAHPRENLQDEVAARLLLDLINSPVMERASLPAIPRSVLWMVLLSFLLQLVGDRSSPPISHSPWRR